MFRVEPPDRPAVFVKIVEAHRKTSLQRAEALAAWLGERGLFVPTALPGFPRWLDDGSGIVALTYVTGRRLEPNDVDLALLGTSLARLHAALATHPARDEWLARTHTRLSGLIETRSALASGTQQAGPDPRLLQQIAADSALDFILPELPAMPLHGDLNSGNLLVADGAVMFMDFEDVHYSVLPVEFELALALERFVLIAGEGDVIQAGRSFLRAYGNAANWSPLRALDYGAVLRSVSLRSLCVLAAAEAEGAATSPAEWAKFFYLEQMTRERPEVIRAIFQGYAS